MCNSVIRYHASIDTRPMAYLLVHCFSPIMPLVALWLLLHAVAGTTGCTTAIDCTAAQNIQPSSWQSRSIARASRHPDTIALALCAATGLVSYLAQRKGFSYQRYPLLIFLLPLLSRDFFHFLRCRTRRSLVALSTLGIATALGMTLLFTHRATTFERTPPNRQLLADLQTYGGATLDGRIQCMDSAGGCIAALYQARLRESTGFIHDCYMLDSTNPVSRALRQRFWSEMARVSPQVIVVTDSVCYSQPRSFDKFAHWPELRQYLAQHYTLVQQRTDLPAEHYWSRTTQPFDYRIYVRQP
jgi:hypothetical protein